MAQILALQKLRIETDLLFPCFSVSVSGWSNVTT